LDQATRANKFAPDYASVTAENSTKNSDGAAEIQKPADVFYSPSCIERAIVQGVSRPTTDK